MGFPLESPILTSFLSSSVWGRAKVKDRTSSEEQRDDSLAHRLFIHLPSPCTAELLSPSVKNIKLKQRTWEECNEVHVPSLLLHLSYPLHKISVMRYFYWAFANPTTCHPGTALFCDSPSQPKLKSNKFFSEIRTAKYFLKLQTYFSSLLKLFAQSFALYLSPVQRKMQETKQVNWILEEVRRWWWRVLLSI